MTVPSRTNFPYPLISLAFEGTAIFTKLDLHNVYHLVQIREGANGRLSSKSYGTKVFVYLDEILNMRK